MFGKKAKTNENIKAAIVNPSETVQPSEDFRETLIKSGLDISAFQLEKSNHSNLSGDEISADKSAALAANKSAQNVLELVKNDKKVLPELGRRQHHLMAIVGILAIIVLQFVFQFSFVQDGNLPNAENLIVKDSPAGKIIEKPAQIEIKKSETTEPREETKIEYKKPSAEILIRPKTAAPKIQRDARTNAPHTTFRKKELRETTAKRLRRAEKILTGI